MNSKITIEHKGKTQTLNWSETVNAPQINTCLVVAPGFYGYGPSIKVAKANCIKAGCPKDELMKAYFGDSSLGVTDFGDIKADHVLIALGEV